MQSSADAERSTSTLLEYSEAASRTAPDAVTHERAGDCERKKARAPSDVWLSSMSMKPASHGSHTRSSRSPRPEMRANRSSSVVPLGGVPPKVEVRLTSASRRAKAVYIDGRPVMSRARRARPVPASEKASRLEGMSWAAVKPRVRADEPLAMNASRRGRTPTAQNIAVYPSSTSDSHTKGRATREIGAW